MFEKEIELKVRELSEDLRREVLDYMEFLIEKYNDKESKAEGFVQHLKGGLIVGCLLGAGWEGGLAEMREEFTSVELQHRASEWR